VFSVAPSVQNAAAGSAADESCGGDVPPQATWTDDVPFCVLKWLNVV